MTHERQVIEALRARLESIPTPDDEQTRMLHMTISRQINSWREDDPLEFSWWCEVDAVLRVCVASNPIAKDDWNRAIFLWCRDQNAYLEILGTDLIPQEFRSVAERVRHRNAYQDGTNRSAAEDWDLFKSMMNEGLRNELVGYTTGIPSLDESLGGFRGLTIVGGDKGDGKTSLCLFMCVKALGASPNLGVIFYSLDMSKTEIFTRILANVAEIPYRRLHARDKSPQEERQLAVAERQLREHVLPRLKVVERLHPAPEEGLLPEDVFRACRGLLSSQVSDIVVVFDLFQMIDVGQQIGDSIDRDEARLSLIRQIRSASRCPERPDGFPIIVTSEVRKHGGKLTRDDLYGSGRLASDADNILLISPDAPDCAEDVVPMTIKIDKGRGGVERRPVQVLFHHTVTRFEDATAPRPQTGAESTGHMPDIAEE
jgi:hypothetical protein